MFIGFRDFVRDLAELSAMEHRRARADKVFRFKQPDSHQLPMP